MRHRNKDKKFGRSTSHRKALVSALICGLVAEKRIKTTLQKAKVARSEAEKLVTLARKGTMAARRKAVAELRSERHAALLCNEIAPQFTDRPGGYTRIVKLGQRHGDGAEMALLEWVGMTIPSKRKKAKPAESSKPAEA